LRAAKQPSENRVRIPWVASIRQHYDRGAGDSCVDVTCAGGAMIRVQTLPEQKNLPSAQASTRSEFGLVMVIVA
jgi:hypothetical protein